MEEKAPTRDASGNHHAHRLAEEASVVEELADQAKLQPEIKQFIANVIVPILIQRYIADGKGTPTPKVPE